MLLGLTLGYPPPPPALQVVQVLLVKQVPFKQTITRYSPRDPLVVIELPEPTLAHSG